MYNCIYQLRKKDSYVEYTKYQLDIVGVHCLPYPLGCMVLFFLSSLSNLHAQKACQVFRKNLQEIPPVVYLSENIRLLRKANSYNIGIINGGCFA